MPYNYPNALIDACASMSWSQYPYGVKEAKVAYLNGMLVGLVSGLEFAGFEPLTAISTVAKALPSDFIRSCWPRTWPTVDLPLEIEK